MSAADESGPPRDSDFYDNAPPTLRGQHGHPVVRRIFQVVLLLVIGQLAASVWTRQLWFGNVGFGSVYQVELLTRTALFAVAFILTEALCHAGVWIAYRYRPIRVPDAAGEAMHRYRVSIEPFRRAVALFVPTIFASLIGLSAAGQWRVPLLWWGRQSFGVTDPHFHRDIGFYVFSMPLIEMMIGFATVILVLSLVLVGLTHYIYGGLLIRDGGLRATRLARTHLGLLAIALLLVRAAGWWWGRYALVYQNGQQITGVDATSVSASLPIHEILTCAALLTALLLLVLLRSRNWRLPTAAISMLAVCSVVFGGLYPDVVSALSANRLGSGAQAVYLQREIDATRAAYGVSDATVRDYRANAALPAGTTAADLTRQVGALPVVDPGVVGGAFQQLKATAPETFEPVLDVGRRGSSGTLRPTVVGVKTLDQSKIPKDDRGWVGRHLIYTHATGVVTASGDTTTQSGAPSFVTSAGASSRIYYGPGLPSYSVVGGKAIEADGTKTTGYRYDGQGGVALGGIMRRVAYAASFRSMDMLTSRSVSSSSRVIYNRDPVQRVQQVAPWLSVDDDAYPVQVGDQAMWVVDGYTTSDRYPYARHQELPTTTGVIGPQVNYVRNSVTAIVNAYDGTVKLYASGAKDPVLRAWEKVFPGSVLPHSELPAAMASQLRYPQSQFEMQRAVLAAFHRGDRASFVADTPDWALPLDPTNDLNTLLASHYQPVTLPGARTSRYSIASTYVDSAKDGALTGYVVANADASAGPGPLSVLQVSGSARSPQQFQDDLSSSSRTSSTLPGTLEQFFAASSKKKDLLIRGNLLTVPVAGGMLQVEPLYLKADSDNSYPQLKAVVVGFGSTTAKGGTIAWGATLGDALADLAKTS